jgi:hypothetical protein
MNGTSIRKRGEVTASLKQLIEAGLDTRKLQPRLPSSGRGLIEACCPLCMQRCRRSFRDDSVAASLKLEEFARSAEVVREFRGHNVAASLKRPGCDGREHATVFNPRPYSQGLIEAEQGWKVFLADPDIPRSTEARFHSSTLRSGSQCQ